MTYREGAPLGSGEADELFVGGQSAVLARPPGACVLPARHGPPDSTDQPIGDFRKAWAAACEAAGVAGALFQNLRRSAVRNFEKAGVSQAVAMKISGHKTASVYRRYRIVDEGDIRDALERTATTLREAPPSRIRPLREAEER